MQVGQKLGEKIDSSEFKTILAVLLLLVGIAIAYDTFIVEESIKAVADNGSKVMGNLEKFILGLSRDFPVMYGTVSIVLAIVLGIASAFIRKFFSNLRKKYLNPAQ